MSSPWHMAMGRQSLDMPLSVPLAIKLPRASCPGAFPKYLPIGDANPLSVVTWTGLPGPVGTSASLEFVSFMSVNQCPFVCNQHGAQRWKTRAVNQRLGAQLLCA